MIGPSPANSSLTRFLGTVESLPNITFENTSAFIAKYPHPDTKITFAMGISQASNSRQFSAQFGSLGGTFSSVATTFNPTPALTISKTSTPSVLSPGSNAKYTVNVTNSSNKIGRASCRGIV